MRVFQAALDTPLDSPLLRHPLSSRFALHGLRAFDFRVLFPLRSCRSSSVNFFFFFFDFGEGNPKGPKIEKIQARLKCSSEIEKSQARRPPDPYFLWGILKVGIVNFQARLKFSSGIENFNRD